MIPTITLLLILCASLPSWCDYASDFALLKFEAEVKCKTDGDCAATRMTPAIIDANTDNKWKQWGVNRDICTCEGWGGSCAISYVTKSGTTMGFKCNTLKDECHMGVWEAQAWLKIVDVKCKVDEDCIETRMTRDILNCNTKKDFKQWGQYGDVCTCEGMGGICAATYLAKSGGNKYFKCFLPNNQFKIV